MTEVQQCWSCRWGWDFEDEDPERDDNFGSCHRHAPQPSEQTSSFFRGRTTWPRVCMFDGCGEWTTRFTDT